MRKTLSLKREALAELSSSELVSVAGGQQELTHLTCGTCVPTGWCVTLDYCPTIPLNRCFAVDLPATLLECIA